DVPVVRHDRGVRRQQLRRPRLRPVPGVHRVGLLRGERPPVRRPPLSHAPTAGGVSPPLAGVTGLVPLPLVPFPSAAYRVPSPRSAGLPPAPPLRQGCRMSRPLASLPVVLFVSVALAADPTPADKQLALQKAMATARQFLDVNMPAEALAALEPEIGNADGNKAFLTLLREAYLAELYRLEK